MDNPQDSNPLKEIKNNPSFGKSLKEYLPYFSGLIILLGLIRQMVYYSYYGVEIQNYIGVSELLLAWMDEAFLFLFLVFISALVFILIFFDRKYENTVAEKKDFRRFKIMSIVTFAIIIVLGFLGLYYNELFQYLIVAPITAIFFLSFYLLAKRILIIFPISLKAFQFIYFSIGILVIFIFLTIGNIQDADRGSYSGTKIYTKDSTYVSDSVHYFIGKTEKYYFIFNKDRRYTTIIPEREVSKFELHWNQKIK